MEKTKEILNQPIYKLWTFLLIGGFGGLLWQYTFNFWLSLISGNQVEVAPWDYMLISGTFWIVVGYYSWKYAIPCAILTSFVHLFVFIAS